MPPKILDEKTRGPAVQGGTPLKAYERPSVSTSTYRPGPLPSTGGVLALAFCHASRSIERTVLIRAEVRP